MLARSYAPALIGIQSRLVSIECDITNGLPGFVVVGLGDKAVEESRERVRSAIKNSGLILPPRRVTLSLAPADLPKDGSGYDLGMAMAILAASGQIDPLLLEDTMFLGELGLDGSIRPVKGVVMAAQLTAAHNFGRLFVPVGNSEEGGLYDGAKVFAVSNLLELYRHILGDRLLSPLGATKVSAHRNADASQIDLSSVYGQAQAKRAVEVAAAGGHNLLLTGPPGTGKTLLAKAMVGLLPKPSFEELLEITKLHNLAGSHHNKIMRQRPFRAPHHTASSVALIGGGTHPRPGEISLAHGGVLFLDELPEFPRQVLEVLRQPLEDGTITVARAAGVVTFPARFMLVATRNPCPCGYFGDGNRACSCKPATVTSYQRKLSGPLLDRIDIAVDVARIDEQDIIKRKSSESTATVARRVAAAREIQTHRLSSSEAHCNGEMSNRDMQIHCVVDNAIARVAGHTMRTLGLSARAYTRILKVARTIADLEGAMNIELPHFYEALQYRPRIPAMETSAPASGLDLDEIVDGRPKSSVAKHVPQH